ncbi:MAG: hypothetical protein EPO39_16570, partial [Candidatus Manganitrophaceae bacterium]
MFEVLRHTTQEEFEGNKPLFQKTRFFSKSYPKNMSDAGFSISALPPISVPSAGPIAVDEKSGLVYVIGMNGVGQSGIQIITPSGALGPFISVSSPSALVIAPAYPGTTLGRLYVAQTGANVIKVFDINGGIDAPLSTAMPDITGLSGPAIKMIRDLSGRDLLFSLGAPSANDMGKYAFRDPPLAPAVIETNTAIMTPSLDVAYDRHLDQLFAIGSNGVGENVLLRIRDSDNGALESFPLFNFGAAAPRFVETDPEIGALFIVSPDGGDLRLRKYSTKGNPTAELDSLVLTGLNANASDGRLAVDATEHLIFVVGGSQLVVVSDRGERLEQMAPVTLPSAGPYHISLDRLRKRLFVSSPTDVSAYIYSLSLATTFLKTDGQVRLIPNAPAVSSDPTKILVRSDFDSDRDPMRPDGPIPAGAAQKPIGLLTSMGAPPPGGPPGKLLPDGIFITASSSPGSPPSVFADLFSYDPTQIYGNGLDGSGPNAEDPGLRQGAMEFWVKLPRLSGVSPGSPPQAVILHRSFLKTRIDPNLFIRKSNLHTDQQELQAILGGTTSVEPTSSITFSPAVADYFIITRLYLDGFQDTDGDGRIDQVGLHSVRYAGIPPGFPLTVTYADSLGNPLTVPFDPVESNQVDSPVVPIPIAGGEWLHLAFSWRIDTNPMPPGGNNKENVQQRLFIDGLLQSAGTLTKAPQLDPDGANGYETIFDLLDDDLDGIVDDGFSQGPSFLQFGAIIFDPTPPTANIQSTIDDLVLYKDETALPSANFSSARFSARSEPFTDDPAQPSVGLFDPGEPFQDVNLSGARDPSGDSFTILNDINKNGIWDVGEDF